jgi:LysM domain-containing protein
MAATTIKRYPLWVIGAVVALCAALALFLLTPGIAQAQNLDNEDAALASRAQGSTNDTQITQVKEDDAGVAAMSPQQQQPQAMQQQPAYYEPAEVRVVRPGDTLWSISEQRLQPNPTPEQIMNEVERIYELNRSQIGDNPNLIFAGQQFLLPALYRETAPAAPVPSGGGPAPSTTTPATTVVPPSAATEQVRGSAVAPEELPSTVTPAQQQQQQPQAAQEEEQNAAAPEPNTSLGNEQGLSSSDQPTTNPNEEVDEEQQAASSATEANEQPRIVPPWPAAQQTPSEQQPTSVADSIAQSFKEFYENSVAERRVLGLGVIALTLGAAVLMVWRLPMKRNVGDPMGWRIPRGGYYYEDSPSSVTLGGPKAVATGAPDATDKQTPNGSSDSDRSSVSSTEQGQTDRASTSSSRSEDGYLGPEENNGEQDSPNGEQDSLSPPPFAAPAPPRQRFRSAPPRAPYRGASRRFRQE